MPPSTARLGVVLATLLLAPACLEGGSVLDGGDIDLVDAGIDAGSFDAGPPVTFKLVDWNVRNFFDEVDDPGVSDTVLTTAQVDRKIGAIAAVVGPMFPDVLTLQEVEKESLLPRLAAALPSSMSLPHAALIPTYDPRGINVAVMSRFPIASAVSHVGERLFAPDGTGPFYYSRDCLEVHLELPGRREVVVLVVHQISQLDTGTNQDEKRLAQAKGARDLADRLRTENPSRPVVIAGDMNDDVSAPSMAVYFAGGAWIDTGLQIPTSTRYTITYDRQKLRYDFILADPATATTLGAVEIIHSADATAASDHSPISAVFTIP